MYSCKNIISGEFVLHVCYGVVHVSVVHPRHDHAHFPFKRLIFYAKDGKAYFVETDECYERSPVRALGDDFRRSFDTYIRWHNSLELNARQVRMTVFRTEMIHWLLKLLATANVQVGNPLRIGLINFKTRHRI